MLCPNCDKKLEEEPISKYMRYACDNCGYILYL